MKKLWTASRGPIAANETDVRKAEAINALLVRPIAILPAKPGDPIRPFALGLWNEIRPLLKPDMGVTALRRATAAFIHSKRYFLASAQPDSMRHDIDGHPVEPLSAEDRLAAQERFMSLKQRVGDEEKPVAEPAPPAPVLSKTEQIRAALLGRASRPSQHPLG
ncbi:ProQ/FINO family protein [Rhizobium puerariae]|uniref:ProQ/FINO family protein n=1 Tax=Rhizobium puerariae TaxID=1585791 RepID=A0ABV6ADM2_9HYPH